MPHPVRRKLQGLAMIVVVALLVAFAVGAYNKVLPWQHRDKVTLYASRIGHQLIVPADVKYHGLIVGQVTGVHVGQDPQGQQKAIFTLEISPDKLKQIPRNVQAEILPKTLFGEKYVDLIDPSKTPSGPSFAAVSPSQRVIEQSTTSIEAEKVFDNLVPLLQALKPAELNLTLSALAETLRGRGDQLGQNLVSADRYLAQFNPHLPTFETDISGLADLANHYNQAAPDLLRMARNFSFNARTLVDKQDQLTQFLAATRNFADVTANFVSANASRLIQLPRVSRPTLEVLARYSPEFPCFLHGLTKIDPLLSHAFVPIVAGSAPELHIRLQTVKQPAGYSYPQDKPVFDVDTGPDCHGLPSNAVSSSSPSPESHNSTASFVGDASGALTRAIAAPLLGVPSTKVSSMTDLLLGPSLQGQAVSLS